MEFNFYTYFYSRTRRFRVDGHNESDSMFDRRIGYFSRLLCHELPSSVQHHTILTGDSRTVGIFEFDTGVCLELYGSVSHHIGVRVVRQIQATQPEIGKRQGKS